MSPPSIALQAQRESWPLRTPFVISRFSQVNTVGLYVRLSEQEHSGHGESEPHESDLEIACEAERQVRACAGRLSLETNVDLLREWVPLAGARNAVDCALWDLRAKVRGTSVWQLLGLREPRPVFTAITLGIDEPQVMGARARALPRASLFKLKLGHGDADIARVEAVRAAAPQARIIVDVNEGWTLAQLQDYAPRLASLRVELIEQPLPVGGDDVLARYRSPVPLCADESCRDRSSLAAIERRYQFINIKLDKTGGLSEALMLAAEAKRRGLGLMTGCNVGTSLAMAPAVLIAQESQYVDLDGPLLLATDRKPAMTYEAETGLLQPPPATLWG